MTTPGGERNSKEHRNFHDRSRERSLAGQRQREGLNESPKLARLTKTIPRRKGTGKTTRREGEGPRTPPSWPEGGDQSPGEIGASPTRTTLYQTKGRMKKRTYPGCLMNVKRIQKDNLGTWDEGTEQEKHCWEVRREQVSDREPQACSKEVDTNMWRDCATPKN